MYSWTPIAGEMPDSVDARRLRQALGAFPTGVCLVTTVDGNGKREGMTINSFASVSLDPPLILWSIRDDAKSASAFLGARAFILSVLGAGHHELAMHFARPAADKFARFETAFDSGIGGCPRPLSALATYECTTWSRHQEGDHTILVGRIENFSHCDTPPLMFHAGRMGSVWELADAMPRPVEALAN